MDRKADTERTRWAWLPGAMPQVAKLLEERKREFGRSHVAECWKRGVVMGEPGWFFAREGAIAVGAPWDDPLIANFAASSVTASQALVVLRPPENAHGKD